MSFDLTKLEAIKNVTVSKKLVTENNSIFSSKIEIPFTPDFMIVKNLIYIPNVNDIEVMYGVSCSIVGDIIAQFAVLSINTEIPPVNPFGPRIFTTKPDLMFKLVAPVKGSIEFKIIDLTDNNTPGIPMRGELMLSLSFIKLKVEKPQIVY